ncbi:cyclic nucleotide-binding domain-containing protein [Marinobacteraceae bacterium S3BR75-40.1]
MYFPGEQPDQVELLLDRFHTTCEALSGDLAGDQLQTFPGSKCEEIVPPGSLVRIKRGTLDVKLGDRVAMILQSGDLFSIPDLPQWPLRYESEESGTLELIPHTELGQRLHEHTFARRFTTLLLLENQLLTLVYANANRYGLRPSAGFLRHRAGTRLVTQGTPSDQVYTLMRGRARVELEGVQVGTVEEGEIFGVLSALVDSPHTAHVIAETDVTVMSVPSTEFIRLVQAQPETFMRLLRTLSRHIGELNRRLIDALRDHPNAGASSRSSSNNPL